MLNAPNEPQDTKVLDLSVFWVNQICQFLIFNLLLKGVEPSQFFMEMVFEILADLRGPCDGPTFYWSLGLGKPIIGAIQMWANFVPQHLTPQNLL